MKKQLALAIIGVAAMFASAAQANEIYGQVGTEGAGIGFAYALNARVNARTEVDGFSFSHNFDAGGIRYDARIKLLHTGEYIDFFPAPTVAPVRLTVGVLTGNDTIDGTATGLNGSVNINGTSYAAAGESIHAKATFPTVRPYVGIGLGHTPTAQKGFSMFADVGVAFGRPHLDYDVPADIVAAAGQANVDAEKQALQDKVNNARFYPIVKVGVTYRF